MATFYTKSNTHIGFTRLYNLQECKLQYAKQLVNDTRANAQRYTNTAGRRHFLMYKIIYVYDNDIKQNQWTMKYRSLTHIYCTRLIFESH